MKMVIVALILMWSISSAVDRDVTSANDLPELIRTRCNEYLIQRLGREMFDSRIIFRKARCYEADPSAPDWSFARNAYYYVSYCFWDPNHSFVRALFDLYVTTDGSYFETSPSKSPPPCAVDPGECSNWLDETEARSIAHEYQFPRGLTEWAAVFKYYPERETFVWAIFNTIGCKGGAAYGSILFIDANSGEIYDDGHSWTTFHFCNDEGEPYGPMMTPPPAWESHCK